MALWRSQRTPTISVRFEVARQVSWTYKANSRMWSRSTAKFGPYVLVCSPSTAELVMAETRPARIAYRFAASLRLVALAPGSVAVVNSEVAPVLSGSPVACPSVTVLRSEEFAAACHAFTCVKLPPKRSERAHG